MDDGLTLQRCQREESQAARIIRNTTALFSRFVRYTSSFLFWQNLFCSLLTLPTYLLVILECFQEITDTYKESYQRQLEPKM